MGNEESENGENDELGLSNLGIGVGTTRASMGAPTDCEFDSTLENNIKNSVWYQGTMSLQNIFYFIL